MKDIDFDELDKAVSSVLSSRKSSSKSDNDTATVETVVPEATVSDTPQADTSSDTAQNEPTVLDVPLDLTPRDTEEAKSQNNTPPADLSKKTTPMTRRTSGRFMDVLHPSSDMSSPNRSMPISRQGVTLAPLVDSISTAPTVPIVAADPVADDEQDSSVQLSTADLGSTPFLPDAKVEKRPLGGASDTETSEEPTPDLASLPEISDYASHEAEVHLPMELRSDLMAVEGEANLLEDIDESPKKIPEPQIVEEKKADPEPTVLVDPIDIPDRHDAKSDIEDEVDDKEVPPPEHLLDPPDHVLIEPHASTVASIGHAGLVSIGQQYTEQPSTGDQQSGAIFDTDVYHQPLVHVPKKKSGWSWVGWILLLLLVGGAGGAVVYLFSL